MTESRDVVVVGAGFAGLYLIHRLREVDASVAVIEAGSGVGGTWYWNRYPGARCDIESMQYSYSFSEALQQEWQWPELFSAQPDILAYANHVADRFDLRRDIRFDTRVTAAAFDADTGRWLVATDRGDSISAAHCVMATGCLSAAQVPDLPGLESYAGDTYHTGEWPHRPVDFSGQRVGLIGTGSSGIQAIPVIAEQAEHLTVFQRTPNYSIPTRNGPMTRDYEQSWKAVYAARRQEARTTLNGVVMDRNPAGALDVEADERRAIYERRWAKGGVQFMGSFGDLSTSQAANDTAADFVREKIRATVEDREVAALLSAQTYPIGTKRICVDSHYFETFNRDNVRLVDVGQQPIERLTPEGVRAGGVEHAFDSIVFATGFDAMTGALDRIDIRGRGGERLREKWAAGPRTYLGLMSAGFPNLYLITGPGSPSVLSNMMVSIEQHVDYVVDIVRHLRAEDLATIEPTEEAETGWVAHVNEVADATLFPKAASWYMGANIPGKPRIFLPYIGGVGAYRERCEAVAANGYEGFRLAGVPEPRSDAAD